MKAPVKCLGVAMLPHTAVAVKTMNWQSMVADEIPGNPTYSAEVLSVALNQECELMQRANHPNIIKLYEVFYTPRGNHLEFSMVMELTPCRELYQWWQTHPTPNLGDIAVIYQNIFKALDYMVNEHPNKPVVHRDLKQQNVLVVDGWSGKQDAVAKLIDFGFAKSAQDHLRTELGTPKYKAPEIPNVKFREVKGEYGREGKCDVWSVGVMMYEMIAGREPWSSHAMMDSHRQHCRSLARVAHVVVARPGAGHAGFDPLPPVLLLLVLLLCSSLFCTLG